MNNNVIYLRDYKRKEEKKAEAANSGACDFSLAEALGIDRCPPCDTDTDGTAWPPCDTEPSE